MLNAFGAIITQLKADIEAAWGIPEARIFLGQQRKPRSVSNGDVAYILLPNLSRSFDGGRSVAETYTFEITRKSRRTDGDATTLADKVAYAQALGDLLAPSYSSIPGSPFPGLAPYAGVAYSREVSSIQFEFDQETTEEDDGSHCVKLTFSVTADVYQ